MKNHFVSDDFTWLLWAQQLDLNWSSLWSIFSNPEFHYNAFYRPLSVVSILIDYKIAGLQPTFYYFVTLLLNGLNIGLLFYFTYLKIKGKRSTKIVGGILTGLIFLLLPVHTDNLMWIASRPDVLATTFGLLALITLVHYRNNMDKYWGKAVLIGILVLASALTKEIVGVTAIAALFIYDFSFTPFKYLKRFKYWSLYFFMFVPGILYLLFRWGVYGSEGLSIVASSHTYMENAWRYMKWLVFPFLENPFFSIVLLVLSVTALYFLFKRNKRLLLFSGIWLVVSFILIQIASGSVNRWRLYFPSLALAILIGAGVAYIQAKKNRIVTSITLIVMIISLSIGFVTLRSEMDEWRLVGDIEHAEINTFAENIEEYSCYKYVFVINEVNNLTTHKLTAFGGKHVVTKIVREYALGVMLSEDELNRLPEIINLSDISINSKNDPRLSVAIIDNKTVDVTAGYVTTLNEEDIFKTERLSRTTQTLTNRITLLKGLTFDDVVLIEYRDGEYYNHSEPCLSSQIKN